MLSESHFWIITCMSRSPSCWKIYGLSSAIVSIHNFTTSIRTRNDCSHLKSALGLFNDTLHLVILYSCSSLWRRSYYITRIKNRKQLNIVNCCVLTWFMLLSELRGGTLLLQFIKTSMFFRMLPAPYWCLRPPSGRVYRENFWLLETSD